MRRFLLLGSLSTLLLLGACGTGEENEEASAEDVNVTAVEEENKQLNEQVGELESQVVELEGHLSEKDEDNSSNTDVTALEEEIGSLKQQVAEKDEQISSLETNLSETESKLEELDIAAEKQPKSEPAKEKKKNKSINCFIG